MILFSTKVDPKVLREEGCSRLEDLISEVAKPAAVSSRAGKPFIRKTITSWLRDLLEGKAKTEDLSPRIEDAIEAAVCEYTVWIPIASLYVESEFRLGEVMFRQLTKTYLHP